MDPDARLPDEVLPKLWGTLVARSRPGVALPLEMARAAPLSFLGGLAHGAQFASDLREALGLFVQNRTVLADRLQLELHEDEHEAALVGSHPLDALDSGRSSETGFGVTARMIAEVLQVENCLLRVEFSHEPHGALEAYRSFFLVPVNFNQPRNALVFRRELLAAPVSKANVELFAYVGVHFDQVRQRIERDRFPAELSKLHGAIIGNAQRGDYAAASAAGRANLSLRSAQRLAAAHGTSLQGMIEEVRAASAKELLSDPDISIESVALFVGYSDDRAFRRAFKRWTGQTPSDFRNSVIIIPEN